MLNVDEHVRSCLHEFPLHLQEKLKDLVSTAHADGYSSGAQSMLAAAKEAIDHPSSPPGGMRDAARDLALKDRADADRVRAAAMSRQAYSSTHPPAPESRPATVPPPARKTLWPKADK